TGRVSRAVVDRGAARETPVELTRKNVEAVGRTGSPSYRNLCGSTSSMCFSANHYFRGEKTYVPVPPGPLFSRWPPSQVAALEPASTSHTLTIRRHAHSRSRPKDPIMKQRLLTPGPTPVPEETLL